MSVIDKILGRQPVIETTTTGDVPPVMAARPHSPDKARKETPRDKTKDRLRRAGIVASILGITESDNESIFPEGAKSIDADQATDTLGLPPVKMPTDSPEEPAEINVDGEELITPSSALVAPDVTPNALVPIDPSAVPSGPGAVPRAPPAPMVRPVPAPPMGSSEEGTLDTILGRQNPAPQSFEAAPELQPVATEAFMDSVGMGARARGKQFVTEAVTPGVAMPDHVEGNPERIVSAFRKFIRK